MKLKNRLLFITAVIVLAIPLIIYAVNVKASVYNPDGAIHNDTTGQWDPPAISTPSDYNNCLACHQTGGSAPAKENYLKGGHKNMSRPVDGKPWGMPGVSGDGTTNNYTGDSSCTDGACLDGYGLFLKLWTQEDYPKWTVNWTATPTTSTVTGGYCGTATGVTSSGDVPDLAACAAAGIECESPIMGNGNAGYPLGYPTQALCEAARKPSTGLNTRDNGAGYIWTASATYPLYWIYGGAGLEGGPPMIEAGTQQYKCGRCHTTGWTGNNSTDTAVGTWNGTSGTLGTKHPWSDGTPVGTTVIGGGATKITKTSTSTSYDYSSWNQWGIECSRCHISAKDGSHANTIATEFPTGGDIVALCMNCHRQESDAKPRGNAGTVNTGGTLAAPTTNSSDINITPYTNKQQQPDGFAHHPDGNEFLNSPHAKFTGTFKNIGCPPYAINGYSAYGDGTVTEANNILNPGAPATSACTTGTMNLTGSPSYTGKYASNFAYAAKTDLTGVSDSEAGSCVTCHDVHQPLNDNVTGMSQSVKVACTDCHSKGPGAISPQINASNTNHRTGVGTPLENVATDPSESCMICHQPPGVAHLWRISTDANYSMYGNYTHTDPPNGNVNLSNMVNDSTGYSAMWIDLDNACGQCHGGGVSSTDITTTTTAAISGKTYSVTVADTTGFASGKEITIARAGVSGADFKTIIASVDTGTNTVYLTYATPVVASAASGAAVTVAGNPPLSGVPYIKKANLAIWAAYMHNKDLPDLVVSALSSPGVIAPGSTITITDTTKNQGAGAAGASTTKFYLSTDTTLDGGDALLGSRPVPALAAGASSGPTTTSVSIPSVSPGYYYIIANADDGDVVSESKESNNTKVKLVQISYPDLVVSALSTTGTPKSGQALTINDTTKNNGPGGIAASTTKFYLSANSTLDGGDAYLGSRGVGAFTGPGTDSGSTPVTLPAVTGYWYLFANANDGCVVTEATCSNNTKWKLIYIAP